MKRYEVTYYLSRAVTIEVDVPNGEEPTEYSWDLLDLMPNEAVIDTETEEIDPE